MGGKLLKMQLDSQYSINGFITILHPDSNVANQIFDGEGKPEQCERACASRIPDGRRSCCGGS